jgi:hypothetical protein
MSAAVATAFSTLPLQPSQIQHHEELPAPALHWTRTQLPFSFKHKNINDYTPTIPISVLGDLCQLEPKPPSGKQTKIFIFLHYSSCISFPFFCCLSLLLSQIEIRGAIRLQIEKFLNLGTRAQASRNQRSYLQTGADFFVSAQGAVNSARACTRHHRLGTELYLPPRGAWFEFPGLLRFLWGGGKLPFGCFLLWVLLALLLVLSDIFSFFWFIFRRTLCCLGLFCVVLFSVRAFLFTPTAAAFGFCCPARTYTLQLTTGQQAHVPHQAQVHF